MPDLRYESVTYGGINLHLCMLSDAQQYDDVGGVAESLGISSAQWSLFGVVWESAHILAEYLVDADVGDARILEVGCGIAVASLVLNRKGADITAMDYHPDAGHFLERNVSLNGDQAIPFVRGSWHDELPELGQFDLIVGSDLLYEVENVEPLANFILRKLAPGGSVVLTDPRRGNQGKFAKKLQAAGLDFEMEKRDKIHLMKFRR